MPKILIIRLSSIGDIVLASPVFRCVKKQVTDAEIHFVTKESFKDVTIHNPYIDRFFYYRDDLNGLIRQLKEEKYDVVVDLHKNFRSRAIAKALGVKSLVINKLNWQKWLLTEFSVNLMPGRHISLRSLDTVASLGVKDDGHGLDYFLSAQDQVPSSDLPLSHSAGFIALVIGANHATKRLPFEQLNSLCRKLNYPLVVLGGADEKETGEALSAIDPIRIYNACGKFSLNESADIVRQSKLVISHDTGLQYIACAFQKPVIAIWGGTSPALDVEPFYGTASRTGNKHTNVLAGLRCQPCSKYGESRCPKGHFKCMNTLDMGTVAALALQKLGIS